DQDGGDVGSFGHQVSRETGKWAQKKGAHTARPLHPALGINLARGWSLDQIPQPRKGFRQPVNRHFWARLRSSSCGVAGPSRQAFRAAGAPSGSLRSKRRLEAQPGFEPGYRGMHWPRVDACRHRANAIMVERAERGYTELWLTLTNPRAKARG